MFIRYARQLEFGLSETDKASPRVQKNRPKESPLSLSKISSTSWTELITSFSQDKQARLLLVLGDFGCGKSTLLRRLMYTLAREHLENRGTSFSPTPLLISLRDYNKVVDIDTLLVSFLNNEVGLEHVNLALFRRLNSLGHFIILLDGFDEMARLVTDSERRITFQELCSLVTLTNKVILSGRPAYFPTPLEMIELLTPLQRSRAPSSRTEATKGNSLILYGVVQLMNDSQLNEYLGKAIGNVDLSALSSVKSLLSSEHIADLARRPVLTNMIVESARELRNMTPEDISLRTLYDVYTSKWIKREEGKGYFRLLINAERKSDFMGLLALQMLFSQKLAMHYGVSGQSKPARDGRMKTSHFESGIAQRTAMAALMRDERTQSEPATFNRHTGGQRLVVSEDRARTGHRS